jgi:oligopeptidase B
MNPPLAIKIKKKLSSNGNIRIDNYYWINERDNPRVINYIKAENEYTEQIMADYSEFKERIYNEIIGRIKQNDESVPYKENGYYYYTRFEEGKEYPIYCRKKGNLNSVEEVLLNVNKLAKGHAYFHVSGIFISPDNNVMAYGVDTFSRRLYTIYFKNIETGKIFDIKIPNTSGHLAWANDNTTIFYCVKDAQTLRTGKIYRHKLGSTLKNDVLIYEEKDETFNTTIFKTKSRQYIMIASYSKTSDEFHYLLSSRPQGKFKVIQPRKKSLEYSVNHFRNKFYIITNYKAKNFRLMETSIRNPGIKNWKELIPHRDDVLLENIEIFSKYFVLTERKDGLIQLRIVNWRTKKENYINFGEEAYLASVGINPEFDSNWLRFNYSSLTTPSSVFDYNMATGKKILKKQTEILGNFNSHNYVAKRLYARARDGKKVPISIVYKKGIKPDTKNPLLLYGYGAYGLSTDPSFSSVRLSLLDRGFIYAIAHIRGGQEMGRDWYEDGKMLHKLNTFYDFIDCAEYLIKKKYTNSNKLFALGGSAGGLLIGSVINMRPDLFKGVIAVVPFVDVVTTMLDESIPLTTSEYDEWGNPNDPIYYNYILSYSPYDNVKPLNYPAILVLTGLNDSQVQYWEPVKWVAKLRTLNKSKNLLLLNTNMQAGHTGASGRFEIFKDTALQYAFMFKILNIKK